ncbi:SPOR domain-containing protein [Bacteroides sp. 224]|uniref:HU domain-containing protein n=1 Tax=Bacteroides sp. 224 TaxID=2302936 RepID=UPI0013D7BB6C|nr:SPOR domain-containing protein [Bacteroides sp. 224]NDV64528.1 SPOR domain-containing protein [Bacteroides sp. 224]
MIDLAQHIEVLLLENDCVIIPGFGGFVTHYSPAHWSEEEAIFQAPTRIIGFNPQLKMNDGILVQSYMEVYNTSFADASLIIKSEVEQLINTLHKEGKIELANIGELSYSIDNSYIFNPYNHNLISPSLYGLDTFGITELKDLLKPTEKPLDLPAVQPTSKKHYEIKINRTLLRNTVAAAITIILFFALSSPIENTQIEQVNYAQLIPSGFLEKIEKHSLLTSLVGIQAEEEQQRHQPQPQPKVQVEEPIKEPLPIETETIKEPIVVEKKVQKASKQKTIKKKQHTYHIIVASVANSKEGKEIIEQLHKEGYKNAQIITKNGKTRVSIFSFSDRKKADNQLLKLRKNKAYKSAWLLPVK